MKTNQSFEYFAKYYDLLYKTKDYDREVAFIEEVFEAYHKPKKLLELGCGTGNYTQRLYQKGYDLTGIDLSDNMLNVAKGKCECEFLKGNIRDISLNKKFDVCLAMFAVMGYITRNSDIIQTLKNIHKHLEPNGLFIFDVWNGLAVLRTLPELRVKEVENNEIKILRVAYPTLKVVDHICEVDYKLFVLNKFDHTFKEFDEPHVVRFYFPQEIKLFLENSGFEVLKICPFLDLDGSVDESVWNITVIAKAVD
jgi:SAM-dependent methyltransferase